MSQNKMSARQLWCWLILAMSAPLMHHAVGGFMVTALAAGAMLPLTLLVQDGFGRMGKAASFLEWIFTAVILAHLLPGSGAYWPSEGSEIAVPLILLALAALTGEAALCARASSTLCWIGGGVLAVVALSALGRMETVWLEPSAGEWNAGTIVTLLLPALSAAIFPGAKGKAGAALLIAGLAVGISAVIQGSLSVSVARETGAAMYEVGRTLGSGYELLVAVGATLGWYAMSCLLLCCGGRFGENCGVSPGAGRIITTMLAAVLMSAGAAAEEKLLVPGCLVAWIGMPMLYGKIFLKKDEKSS